MDEYYRAIQSLPSWLSRPLAELPVELAEQVHEIRLRVGCPVQMTISGVLCTSACVPALRQIVLTQLQMDEIFLTLCDGSVHTHQAEVAQGYVTLPNGCRAGLGGRFFCIQHRARFCSSSTQSTSALPGGNGSPYQKNCAACWNKG